MWAEGARDEWYGRQVLVHAPGLADDGRICTVVSGPFTWDGAGPLPPPHYQVAPVGARGGPLHPVSELLPIQDIT